MIMVPSSDVESWSQLVCNCLEELLVLLQIVEAILKFLSHGFEPID